MADGATTFVPESINFVGTGMGGAKFDSSKSATRVTAAKAAGSGVFQKLSVRNDGNPASLPE